MGLVDIDSSGLPYTWYNKRITMEAIIKIRSRSMAQIIPNNERTEFTNNKIGPCAYSS